MSKIQGGCHCGNISYFAELSNEPSAYHPRACGCQFCMAHRAAYLSDEQGSLSITIENEDEISRYNQGSGICDFLVCRKCGVLSNVIFEENQSLFGAINARSINNQDSLGETEAAHLIELSDEERIQRWKRIWFPNVNLQCKNT